MKKGSMILVFMQKRKFPYSWQKKTKKLGNLFINLACLGVCLSVCLLVSNNVKTAEPIGPKFFVGHHVIPGKVYE